MPMQVALIGYGEVGKILAEDLRARGVAVTAYDLTLDGAQAQPLGEHAARHGVLLRLAAADPASRWKT